MLWLALVFMGLCAAAFVALPFLAPAAVATAPAAADTALRAELETIAAAFARGELSETGAADARIDAERRAIAAPAAQPARSAPVDRRSGAIAGAGLLAGAALLYALMGEPNVPGARPPVQTGAQAQLNQLIRTLGQRVHEAPDDADGWRALGWAYFIGARYDESQKAYSRAVALRPDNAAFRSAYGESLVGAAQGAVTAPAASAFQNALARDKTDVRARFYLGLLKAQNGDAKAAIAAWLALYREAPAGSEAALDLRRRIETLAKESGVDVSAQFSSAGSGDVAAMSDQEREAMIEAMVSTLDQRLRANPYDLEGWTRLVHARVVQGKSDEAADALKRARAAFAGDGAAQAQLDQLAAQSGLP